jgi:hypothetical protein
MASPETMRCFGCGYDLHGLPENRCPECGRAFDPSNSTTFLCRLADGRKYLAAALLGVFGMMAPVMMADLLRLAFPGQILGWAAFAMFSVGLLTTAAVLGVSIKRLRGPPAATVHRNALVAALLISLVPYVVFVGWVALGLLAVIVERVLG